MLRFLGIMGDPKRHYMIAQAPRATCRTASMKREELYQVRSVNLRDYTDLRR